MNKDKTIVRKIEDTWNLSDFSRMLEEQGMRNEDQRKMVDTELERIGVVTFVRDASDPPGHGIGWFKMEHGFFAFRRHSNGYEMRPCMSLEFDLVRKLAEALR